jgi:hypothetical protein
MRMGFFFLALCPILTPALSFKERGNRSIAEDSDYRKRFNVERRTQNVEPFYEDI